MREARFDFNPCEFHEILYLCGGWCFSIEAFDPKACTFLQVQALLPESTDTLAFAENCELVVMSFNYVTRWNAGLQHGLLLRFRATHPSVDVVSSLPPILDSVNSILYYSYCGSCESIQLDDYEESP